MKGQKNNNKVWYIVAALVIIAAISLACIMIFSPNTENRVSQKVTLSEEYREKSERIDIEDAESLEELLSSDKTFILTSYLPTCTANIISFIKNYTEDKNISYYHISWSNLKKTSLDEKINFPPTVMVISNGNIVDALKSDSNDYIDQYDNYDAFKAWLDSLIAE